MNKNSSPLARCYGERRKGGKGEGREKILFLSSLPAALIRPIPSSLLEFQHGAFAGKNIRAPEENARTAGYISLYGAAHVSQEETVSSKD